MTSCRTRHYTHEKSPVGAAAALATLDVIEQEGLVARSRALGREGLDRLRSLVARSPLLGAARGRGLYWGLEVTDQDGMSAQQAADRILYACLERGLSFKLGGSVVTLCPPMTISTEQLAHAFDILESATWSIVQDS